MAFKKATKAQSKLRLALEGPAGSGKTYTALQVAQRLGGKVAVIDTERGSASKYADLFAFDSVEPSEFSLETYMKHIAEAASAGYEVLVIDSLSHAWAGKGGALETVDRLGAAAKGNKFSGGWKEVTPLQTRLLDSILAHPGHVIATMRVKTEWVLETNERGKQQPRKVGLAPVQREGVEYEFDVIAELDIEGHVTVTKSRCPGLSGAAGSLRYADVPALADKLKAWLSDGVAPVAKPLPPVEAPKEQSPRAALVEALVVPTQLQPAPEKAATVYEQIAASVQAAKTQAEAHAAAMQATAAKQRGALTVAEFDAIKDLYARVKAGFGGRAA